VTLYRTASQDQLCMSCLREGHHAPDCADRTSGWDTLRRALLFPTAEMPVEPPPITPRVPVWALVSIFSGLVLMAFGWVMTDEVAVWVWGMIQG